MHQGYLLSKYEVISLIPASKNCGVAEHHALSSCSTDSALLTADPLQLVWYAQISQSLNSCLHALLGASTSKKEPGDCEKAGNFTI